MISSYFSLLTIGTYFTLGAFFIGVVHWGKIEKIGRWALIILMLNVIADLTGNYLIYMDLYNVIVYNISSLIEITLTGLAIILWSREVSHRLWRTLFILIILAIIALLWNLVKINIYEEFNYEGTGVAAIFIVLNSYIVLRKVYVSDFKAKFVVYFSIANIIYYSYMSISLTSVKEVLFDSWKLANEIKLPNDIAYCIWSLILAVGFIVPSRW